MVHPIIYRVSTMQDAAGFPNHRQYFGVKNGAAYLHHFDVRGPKVAATGIAAFVGGALLFCFGAGGSMGIHRNMKLASSIVLSEAERQNGLVKQDMEFMGIHYG